MVRCLLLKRNEDNNRRNIIERLVTYVADKLPQNEAPLVKSFIRHYYFSVSPEDLASKSILDLYGAVVAHWHYILIRKPKEIKVRAYNPQIEQHGWQSTHTVIEISCDDVPFLVDSVSMALHRLGFNIHLIIHMENILLKRDESNRVIEMAPQPDSPGTWIKEAAIYIEIDRQSDPKVLESIVVALENVLHDVYCVVEDWSKMKKEIEKILTDLNEFENPDKHMDLPEVINFLYWINENHFTFLGYQERILANTEEGLALQVVSSTNLGLMKHRQDIVETQFISALGTDAQQLILGSQLLILGKSDAHSTVHRPAYMDFIAVKKIDKEGNVLGLRILYGLYTAIAYNSSPLQLPYLRHKVRKVLLKAGFQTNSHDERALLNILETLPRDDLFQASEDELLELATGILYLQERQIIRLFMRQDIFGHFVSCLVYMPRGLYNSALSLRMQNILMKGIGHVRDVEFSTRFSESVLARLHFVIHVEPNVKISYDKKVLEEKLQAAGRTWKDDLTDALREHYGEEKGNDLFKRYGRAFTASYKEAFSARVAVIDIEHFEGLTD